MTKRSFDFFVSLIGLILLSPVFLLLICLIKLSSKGGAFYKQLRVGQHGKDFTLLKFRSMYVNSDRRGLLTVGSQDKRITPIGIFIRDYKLDELPQLINVFLGDMSLVGPRPEVRKYVELYSPEELKVLDLKPGITDLASIKYKNENDILSAQESPEQYYIEVIMPDKIKINLSSYDLSKTVIGSIKIIIITLRAIVKRK
ncbi:sugar transferase [Pedobacter heparinus]|uniref:Sugar transferase n=1 Tax=Pedobacter heparinus (strain ATCC 13125 / DSM 2366 / CIP 104194 / JCM 7457 / NBRC 12017 / NCIMB 9290 / NRRL B-14731 / HIM 762-3) TaxID=485917 RepID=C6XVN6_PEDHD|nr:sugar transferase [Pedobacter heparinus]ACU06111.1 sugar transferase [Pedobacter heparinus DSM 2366]